MKTAVVVEISWNEALEAIEKMVRMVRREGENPDHFCLNDANRLEGLAKSIRLVLSINQK